MRALSSPKTVLALIGALPVFWLSGHVVDLFRAPWGPLSLASVHMTLSEVAIFLALFWCGTLLSALAVGFVLAYTARAIGHGTIRTLLSPSQAQIFGLLATALVWLSITGLVWSNYSGKSQIVVIAWYLALGVAIDLFNALWLVLGVRAAAAVRQLHTAGMFFAASIGAFLGALGLIVLLSALLDGVDLQPTLLLFGIQFLLIVVMWVLPPALAVAGGAALCAGILASRAPSSSAGDASNM